MARPHSSRETDAATAGVSGREGTGRGRATELALLALMGLALAGGSLCWKRRGLPPAEVTVQAPATRTETRVAPTATERLRVSRVESGPHRESAVVVADAPPAAKEAPPLTEDRALGQPHVPIAAAPHVRAPDPPPPSPLDPDEVTRDDPRDFELPAPVPQQP
jgi:hypothetical protein